MESSPELNTVIELLFKLLHNALTLKQKPDINRVQFYQNQFRQFLKKLVSSAEKVFPERSSLNPAEENKEEVKSNMNSLEQYNQENKQHQENFKQLNNSVAYFMGYYRVELEALSQKMTSSSKDALFSKTYDKSVFEEQISIQKSEYARFIGHIQEINNALQVSKNQRDEIFQNLVLEQKARLELCESQLNKLLKIEERNRQPQEERQPQVQIRPKIPANLANIHGNNQSSSHRVFHINRNQIVVRKDYEHNQIDFQDITTKLDAKRTQDIQLLHKLKPAQSLNTSKYELKTIVSFNDRIICGFKNSANILVYDRKTLSLIKKEPCTQVIFFHLVKLNEQLRCIVFNLFGNLTVFNAYNYTFSPMQTFRKGFMGILKCKRRSNTFAIQCIKSVNFCTISEEEIHDLNESYSFEEIIQDLTEQSRHKYLVTFHNSSRNCLGALIDREAKSIVYIQSSILQYSHSALTVLEAQMVNVKGVNKLALVRSLNHLFLVFLDSAKVVHLCSLQATQEERTLTSQYCSKKRRLDVVVFREKKKLEMEFFINLETERRERM